MCEHIDNRDTRAPSKLIAGMFRSKSLLADHTSAEGGIEPTQCYQHLPSRCALVKNVAQRHVSLVHHNSGTCRAISSQYNSEMILLPLFLPHPHLSQLLRVGSPSCRCIETSNFDSLQTLQVKQSPVSAVWTGMRMSRLAISSDRTSTGSSAVMLCAFADAFLPALTAGLRAQHSCRPWTSPGRSGYLHTAKPSKSDRNRTLQFELKRGRLCCPSIDQ